jgi:hypothetical protein
MKQTKFAYYLLICLSLLFIIAEKSFGGDKVTLKLNLKKGDVFHYNMTTVQNISQSIKKQDINIKQTMTFDYLMDVKNIDAEGSYVIDATYDKIKISLNSMGSDESYDSEDTTVTLSKTGKIYSCLKGATLGIVLTSSGKVTKVTGINKLIDKMIATMGIKDESMEKTMRTSLQSMVGEETMKQSFGNGFDIYPDGPVSVGSTWTKEMNMKIISSVTIKNEYKVTDIKDNLVNIDVKSTISTDPGAKGIEMMSMTMNYKLKGSQKGNSEMEIGSGMVTKSTITQDISGTVSMSGLSDDGKDNSWPISILSTITITTDKRK